VARFSEREGFVPAKVELAKDEMPEALWNGLWDVVATHFFSRKKYWFEDRDFESFCKRLWFNHFKETMDQIPTYPGDAVKVIKRKSTEEPFFLIYDLIEFCLEDASDNKIELFDIKVVNARFNAVLIRERAAYRIVGMEVTPISDPIEAKEVEEAQLSECAGVAQHIRSATILLSDREKPDFRNSMKESISAVEAAVRHVVDKKTAGVKPVRQVADQYRLHPALIDGFDKLYAYTSDADGIRHSMMDSPNLSFDDAKYMLVSCSAFANYLIAKSAKQND